MDHEIRARRLDLVIIDKKNKRCPRLFSNGAWSPVATNIWLRATTEKRKKLHSVAWPCTLVLMGKLIYQKFFCQIYMKQSLAKNVLYTCYASSVWLVCSNPKSTRFINMSLSGVLKMFYLNFHKDSINGLID